MKFYDFDKIKKIAKEEISKNDIQSIVLGMAEDFEDTHAYIYEQSSVYFDELEYDDTNVQIKSSNWATPIMRIYYKSGEFKEFPVYIESNDGPYYAYTD